jgi:hypothetical protein
MVLVLPAAAAAAVAAKAAAAVLSAFMALALTALVGLVPIPAVVGLVAQMVPAKTEAYPAVVVLVEFMAQEPKEAAVVVRFVLFGLAAHAAHLHSHQLTSVLLNSEHKTWNTQTSNFTSKSATGSPLSIRSLRITSVRRFLM